MKSKTVIMAVGLPGAGKTSYSNAVASSRQVSGKALHVEDWLDANHEHHIDRYGNALWASDVWANLWSHVRDLFRYGSVVIVEGWYPTLELRVEAIDGLRSVGVNRIVAWHFQTPPAVCRRRFIDREVARASSDDPCIHHKMASWWDYLSWQYKPVTQDEVVAENDSEERRRCKFDRLIEADTSLPFVPLPFFLVS